LVSSGFGVTPMLGIVRQIAAAQPVREVRMLHGDDHAADAALVRVLDENGTAQPEEVLSQMELWISLSTHVAPELPDQERSRVSAGRVEITAEHLPDGAETYLCGSSAFLQGAREQLRLAGADEERVHFELFSPNDWLLPGS